MKVLLSMANNTSTPYFNRLADIAKHQKDDIELIFLCLYPTKPLMIDDMRERGFKCYWIRFDSTKRKTHLLTACINACKLLKKLKPDIVHTHLFDDSLPVLLAARLAGIKNRVISKLDAGFHYQYKPKWTWFDRFNNWNANKIVAVSGENSKFIIEKEKAKPEKIVLIHQGLDVQEVTSHSITIQKQLIQKYDLHNKKVILTVSRYIEWKGYRYIIEAASLLKDKYPDIVFVFVGYGEQQTELEEIVKNRGLTNNIKFTGWVNRNELNNFYSIADVFVHAAINEPFGFVIAEAMINKVPVVATKTGAALDAIKHKGNGYLTNKKDGQDLADGIIYMLENNTSNITESAYKIALQMFTVEKMWENHFNLYKAVLN